MNYLIDIDGTITDDVPNEEFERMSACVPFEGAVAHINRLFDEGHIITFFTSRTESMRRITEDWLDRWGFRYHGVLMGKPRGGNYVWIDNLSVEYRQYPQNHSWNV